MLKIKDNVDLRELIKKYDLDEEADSDYESGYYYSICFRDDVYIDQYTKEVYGTDNGSLELLYDLIKADLVEKVGVDKSEILHRNIT